MNAANPNMTKIEMERSLKLNRSRKNLRRDVGKAIADYSMIEHGDKVMVSAFASSRSSSNQGGVTQRLS